MSEATLENLSLILLLGIPISLTLLLHYLFGIHRVQERWPPGLALGAGNALGLGLCVALLSAGGELYFRFAVDTTDAFGVTKITRRWLNRHYQLNSAGMRDDLEYAVTRPPGLRRITFVGDSFSAGYGIPDVEDRFANLIRARRPGWEVHVLADNGWNTGAHVGLLGSQAAYELDFVVLVYGLNDISDIDPAWEVMRERLYETGQPSSFFTLHSYLFNTLHYRWVAFRSRDLGDYYLQNRDAYASELWKAQRKRLKYFAQRVRERGGRLAVITFPFLHAVGPDYAYQPVHDQLGKFWIRLDVPHLDLLSLYADRDPHELVVNAHDTHPNEYAHEMAATAILPFLDSWTTRPAPSSALRPPPAPPGDPLPEQPAAAAASQASP